MSEPNKDQQIESLEEKVTHLSRMLVKSFGYADQDPDTFLQNARRTTEAICRFMYTKELGEPKSKMMLNDYGRELLQKKVIPDKIGILIGTIQTYGNYAAHAQDDLSEATREWIAPCQTALASLTNWFFLEYLKGNVPNELITPVQSYAESGGSRNTNITASTVITQKKSPLVPILLVTLIVLMGGLSAFYFLKKGTNEVATQPEQTANATENTVNQQEAIVDNLNSAAPNADAKRIAILYFDNGSDNAELSRLRKGLADMLISDLSKINMLNVIERARLEEILKEQKLNNSKEFDASTATKVGKLLGVQYILTGAFFDLMGSMRMDARIIDVETGKIIKSEGIDGQTNTFFDLEKKLVVKIASGLNVDLNADNKDAKTSSLSYETSLWYSDALDKMDKGENGKAIELLKKVLQKNPDFTPAQQALNKLTAKV